MMLCCSTVTIEFVTCFFKKTVQDELVLIQPEFKTKLLHEVDVFQSNVNYFEEDYATVSEPFLKFHKNN